VPAFPQKPFAHEIQPLHDPYARLVARVDLLGDFRTV
jgi:hypothetical protein